MADYERGAEVPLFVVQDGEGSGCSPRGVPMWKPSLWGQWGDWGCEPKRGKHDVGYWDFTICRYEGRVVMSCWYPQWAPGRHFG